MFTRGRRSRRSIVILLSAFSLVVASPGVADAATGGNLILGQANVASSSTGLTANVSAAALAITNQATGTGATGLSVTVAAGKPPLTVNSTTKVVKLNADLLDGIDSSAFQRRLKRACPEGSSVQAVASDGTVTCEDTAANATLFDGMHSSDFIHGAGDDHKGALAIPSGNVLTFLSFFDPDFGFYYNCPSDLSRNGVLGFENDSPETVNVFYDNGATNPVYNSVAPAGWLDLPAAAGAEHYTFQIQGSQITTVDIFTVHRPASNDCHTQGHALVSR